VLVKISDFKNFLKQLLENNIGQFKDIIVPARAPDAKNNNTILASVRDGKEIILDHYRTIDPVKIMFYHTRELLTNTNYRNQERILAGVKACDLKALTFLDNALINKDFVDPAYKHWRDHTTIISSDCSSITENCHCNLLGGKPYPESGYDINLSKIDDHFFILSGSEKGNELIELIKKTIPYSESNNDTESLVEKNRKSIFDKLKEQNTRYSHSDNYVNLKTAEPLMWSFESKDCIGCGACTNICPTCYCLILNDESIDNNFVKIRSYDSCQLNGYAKVAGGGTPRPKMHERFRNRYLCKFDYMLSNFNEPGCTGCGRCIDTCAAGIDFRSAIDDLCNHKELIHDKIKKVPSSAEVEVEA
jgi:sulfhydrogenase subunit beta (sulfur reductase)